MYAYCYCLLLFIWSPTVLPDSPSSCDPCIQVTLSHQGVAWTFLYSTHFSCPGEIQEGCIHNGTIYSICKHGDQYTCFDPQYSPNEEWLEMRRRYMKGTLITRTLITNPKLPVSVLFDACEAMDGSWLQEGATPCGSLSWERSYRFQHKYMCEQHISFWARCRAMDEFYCPYWGCESWTTWDKGDKVAILQKGTAPPDCTTKTCNPVNFTIYNTNEPRWKEGFMIGIRIHGWGTDPGILLYFQRVTVTLQTASHQITHSFYEKGNTLPPIFVKTKNSFLALAETTAQTLKVSSCYVCGGTDMGDQWHCQATELDPLEPYNETRHLQCLDGIWFLKTSIIGRNCLAKREKQCSVPVGRLICFGHRYYNVTTLKTQSWGSSKYREPNPNPLPNFSHLQQAWGDVSARLQCQASKGLYWICGKMAYSVLSCNLSRAFVLGTIRPCFFLLPLSKKEQLGIPICKTQGTKKNQRDLQIGDWKDDKWPPECSIQYYGPAPWAEDGSWEYCTLSI
uniref:endogenous retrovirus group 3 member 1 Env polyprotein-like n=1 Tax=Ictidomys tridecemlineatus TaxID=43179 RepID=UPI001A9F1164|nr:endogenous retrovirus group 3 member 1 Env polyprotein-like [Ictidomys tridecemlineatus]